jgi:hypothetical protein
MAQFFGSVILKLFLGEGIVCEISAVQFIASFNDQRFEKKYIAKYAPDGTRADFMREVTNK